MYLKRAFYFSVYPAAKRSGISAKHVRAIIYSANAVARVCCAGISSRKIFVHLWVRQKKKGEKKDKERKRETQNGERAAKARGNVWPRNGCASVFHFPH